MRLCLDRGCFSLAADHLTQLAWIVEPNGEVSWVNKRWLDYTGQAAGGAAGPDWRSVVHNKDHARVEALFREAAAIASGSCRRSDVRSKVDADSTWSLAA